jgi:hypothetical protein
MVNEEKEYLCLKWGTLKGWEFKQEKTKALFKEFCEIGMKWGAAQQKNSQRQKEIICELIDLGNFETVYNDWDGEEMTKKAAKEYVMNY